MKKSLKMNEGELPGKDESKLKSGVYNSVN